MSQTKFPISLYFSDTKTYDKICEIGLPFFGDNFSSVINYLAQAVDNEKLVDYYSSSKKTSKPKSKTALEQYADKQKADKSSSTKENVIKKMVTISPQNLAKIDYIAQTFEVSRSGALTLIVNAPQFSSEQNREDPAKLLASLRKRTVKAKGDFDL